MSDNEFNDLRSGTAIADPTGRRHGRIVTVVIRDTWKVSGIYRVHWTDTDETQMVSRDDFLVRYTTQSSKF